MKKIIIASLLVVMAASSSFAADTALPADMTSVASKALLGLGVKADTTTGATIGRLSSSDGLGWGMTTAGYTLITQHLQGTRAYGTSHDGTAIYWHAETKGAGHSGAPTVGVSYFPTNTGWTVM